MRPGIFFPKKDRMPKSVEKYPLDGKKINLEDYSLTILVSYKLLVDGEEKFWVGKCRCCEGDELYRPVVIQLLEKKGKRVRRYLNVLSRKGRVEFRSDLYGPDEIDSEVNRIAEKIFDLLASGKEVTLVSLGLLE